MTRQFDKSKLPSRHVSVGPERAPHRSYYYAMGLTEDEIALSVDRETIGSLASDGRCRAARFEEDGGIFLAFFPEVGRVFRYIGKDDATLVGRARTGGLADASLRTKGCLNYDPASRRTQEARPKKTGMS